MEQGAAMSTAKRELERVNRDIKNVIEPIKAGFVITELKAEMDALQSRKEALLAQLRVADEPSPLPHPNMADLYRGKVEQLAIALRSGDEHERAAASEGIRGFVDAIVLTPDVGKLNIEVRGNLAAMLDSAQKSKRSPEGDLSVPVQMVAGACNQRYLQLWSGAA
jgi:site-specific DNA recombinase